MQKNTLPPQGSSPSDTPPSSKPLQTPLKDYDKIEAIELVEQCRFRLRLVSSYVLNDKCAPDEALVIPAALCEALYFSLISIEDDLERAVDRMALHYCSCGWVGTLDQMADDGPSHPYCCPLCGGVQPTSHSSAERVAK